MAVKKNHLGKVLENVNGYNIRQMGTSKSIKLGIKEKPIFQPSGEYGVYAGRKKLKKGGFKSVNEAVDFAKTL
jgi:hypothetical protein